MEPVSAHDEDVSHVPQRCEEESKHLVTFRADDTISEPAATSEAQWLLVNGVVFCLAFSVLESCIASLTYISAALVDREIATSSNSMLFTGFSLGTIAAPQGVLAFGTKRSLLLGMTLITLYLCVFLFPTPLLLYPSAVTAGGFGALLWTAQGCYLTELSHAHALACAACTSASVDEVDEAPAAVDDNRSISLFSGLFAAIFPAMLTLGTALSSLVYAMLGTDVPSTYLLGVYAMLSGTSTLVMLGVRPFSTQMANLGASPSQMGEGLRATLHAFSDPDMLLMAPTNITFGLMLGLFPFYLTPLVASALGKEYVGTLYSCACAVDSVLALGFSCCQSRTPHGRMITMVLGWISFTSACVVLLAVDEADFNWAVFIFLFCAWGAGKAVWQGTCMAVFADYFAGAAAPAAFAFLKLTSSGATMLGFYIFPHCNMQSAAASIAAIALIAIVSYCITHCRFVKRRGLVEIAAVNHEVQQEDPGSAMSMSTFDTCDATPSKAQL